MPDPFITLIGAALITGLGMLIFWPERGLFERWQRARQMNERVLIEDALKHIFKCETKGRCPTLESTAGALSTTVNQVADILAQMAEHDLLQMKEGKFCLTPAGRDYALHIIRAHRLWERYLADETGFAEAEWHDRAERYEHTLSPAEVDALSAQLGHPTHDPHGHLIPTANGKLAPHCCQPLTTIAVNESARIAHLADEPETIYAQLVAEGLHAGAQIHLIESTPQRIRFWADGGEHILAPIVAANISVVPLPKEQAVKAEPGERLTSLKPGQKAQVLGISRASRGPERRRLMDLGILGGTVIEAEMTSPSGDPTAYRIRGALIGLREEQAKLVNIVRLQEENV